MNKIYQLFDQNFVMDLFRKEILPQYPYFGDIKKIKITPIKEYIWYSTYHVVIEFKTTFLKDKKASKTLSIYCSAHSNEPRKSSFEALKFLWDNNFGRSRLTVPHPLFYSDFFNAYFYRGVVGKNLYYFIRQQNFKEIELILLKVAAWLAKLHQLPTSQAKNFNQENSRIETVFPGTEVVLTKIKNNYPQYFPIYQQIYQLFNTRERKFFLKTKKLWVIHGDAHPKNIIKISKNKLAVIDFTDICLADFARDLGTFLQQLEFMCQGKIDLAYIEKIKNLFLISYLKATNIELTENLRERINNYYNWAAIRTANLFLLKEPAEPARAHGLIFKVGYNLGLNFDLKSTYEN